VYYAVDSSGATKNLAGTVSGTSYTHSSVTASTTYYYYIIAVNSEGAQSGYSSYASATTNSGGGGGGTAPSAPTGVSATAQSSNSISVSWSSVSGATGYRVYYAIGSSGASKTLANTVTGTSYTHTGLSASTTYYYYIIAVNSAGESAYSSSGSAITSSGGGGPETILVPSSFTVTKQSNGVIALLSYSTSQKSTVDTYTYLLYEDGDAVFAYTDAPNQQADSYGTTGLTTTEGSSYGVALIDQTLLLVPGTYKIKVEVRKTGSTSYFTAEKTVIITN
jgi:fibronectin type 3 domain-containing protein